MAYNDPSWIRDMGTDWKEVISKNKPGLCMMIDRSTEAFIDHLESMKVFNNRTCQNFKSIKCRYDQNSAILTALLKRPVEDFGKFCQALKNCGQKHVIDEFFLSNKPILPISTHQPSTSMVQTATDAQTETTERPDDPLKNVWKKIIQKNYSSLVRGINPDDGLLNHLISKKVITEWMQDTFMTYEGRSKRAEAILSFVLKRPFEDFRKFCNALTESNQKHIVDIYFTLNHSQPHPDHSDCGRINTPNSVNVYSNSEALELLEKYGLSNMDWKAVFVENWRILVNDIEPSYDFIHHLLSLGVFNQISYEKCEEKHESLRMNFILNYMGQRPDEDFIRFCIALEKTDQSHVIQAIAPERVQIVSSAPTPHQSITVPHVSREHDAVQPVIQTCEANQSDDNNMDQELIMLVPTLFHNQQSTPLPEEDARFESAYLLASRGVVCHPVNDSEDTRQEILPDHVIPHGQHQVPVPVDGTEEVHQQIFPNPGVPFNQHAEPINIDDGEGGPMEIMSVYVKHSDKEFYEKYHGDAYPISRRNRGFCLIINNEEVTGMDTREGTQTDGKLLKQLFEGLNFEVWEFLNKPAEEVKQIVRNISEDESLRDHQCLIVFVMSHGKEFADASGRKRDCIYGSDGQPVAVDDILWPFTDANCQNLIGKPRLVFFQACRGDYYQTQTDAPEPPVYRDFLIGYPTQREYPAFRDTLLGSWYINALVQIFMEQACDRSLSDLLTYVSGKVGKWVVNTNNPSTHNKGQSATYESHLTKPFYFFPGIVC